MTEEKIARINELYKKSKAEGLTEEEAKEQHALRQEYLDSVRKNLRSQLNWCQRSRRNDRQPGRKIRQEA